MGQAREVSNNYTYQEYLELEQKDQQRYEFHYGEVFAMASGSKRHNQISRNVANYLTQNTNQEYESYLADIKVELQKAQSYVYPDVLLTCHPNDPQDDTESLVRKPVLIVEVLSPSTEDYDQNQKRKSYFKLPSLQYYILISQKEPQVEMYERHQDFWAYRSYSRLDDTIALPLLGILIGLEKIYEGLGSIDAS